MTQSIKSLVTENNEANNKIRSPIKSHRHNTTNLSKDGELEELVRVLITGYSITDAQWFTEKHPHRSTELLPMIESLRKVNLIIHTKFDSHGFPVYYMSRGQVKHMQKLIERHGYSGITRFFGGAI
jgi:hypothetical protein